MFGFFGNDTTYFQDPMSRKSKDCRYYVVSVKFQGGVEPITSADG